MGHWWGGKRTIGAAGIASLILAGGWFVGGTRAQAPAGVADFLWLEAENVAEKNVKGEVSGWGHKEFLSGDTWFQVSIPAERVEQEIPAGGAVLKYTVSAPKAARYEVWNRIGYEFARSPFEWRMDSGAWQPVSPEQLTTDLMEIETWNEVAWLKMGDADLSAGNHTLEIRLPRTKDEKGKTARILYASDALCLTAGKFFPNGKFKPNEEGRTDADRAAEKAVFSLPDASKDGQRANLSLAGDWEVCRNDEQTPPFDIAQPMKDFPEHPVWHAIPVPSDKNVVRPDLTFAHRLWYRTRVSIPKSHEGRSFFLTFPRNNLNTTVFVNGVYCGFEKNPNVRFQMDITKGVKPGQVNEIWVGIRDAWYGYSTNPNDPLKLRKKFNLPLAFVSNGFQDLAYPIWHAWESGIVQTPTLTSAGPVFAADVFVRPDVAKKELAADVTVHNSTKANDRGFLRFDIRDVKTGKTVKTFVPPYARDAAGGGGKGPSGQSTLWTEGLFDVAAGAETVVRVRMPFPEAKLWWPVADPQLYRLAVTVSSDNTARPVENQADPNEDHAEVRFGFREWGSKGKDFTLNGQVWHGWADLCAGETPAEFLAQYRKTGQRFFRMSGYAQGGPTWHGLTPTDALDFADANGMVVRRCGDLDGEAIGYMAVENDPDLKKRYGTEIKQQLINNWRDQMVAQVKAERNHPSIHVWSIENEWLYINCINLYGGLMDQFEAAEKTVMDAVQAADPTRLPMADGGGAGKANLFPVHGDHYVYGDPTRYPSLAYEQNPDGGGRGRWKWDGQRPRYIGEDYYANGINPADYAALGGEEPFQGKAATRRAAGLIEEMLTQGYRWAEFGAFHFWLGSESAVNQYKAFAPLAVFCRQWDSAFPSGGKVARTLGIFNDTFDVTGSITLKWTLTVGGKPVASQTTTHTIPPGTNEKFDVTLPIPTVSGPRAGGEWTLTLTANGKEQFRDTKPISILAPRFPRLAGGGSGGSAYLTGDVAQGRTPPPTERQVLSGERGVSTVERNASAGVGFRFGGEKKGPAGIAVYDPNGGASGVGTFLKARGVAFAPVNSLAALPANVKVLIVGRDALTEADSTPSALAAWASQGKAVIVLEQKNPLKYTALPAGMEPATNTGETAFIEDASHPVFAGLKDSDFFTWPGAGTVYRDAYEKPTRGAKSLLQCDNRLARTALAEVTVGSGLMLLCQARVEETLSRNPVAQQLLANLIVYGVDYRQTFRPVAVAGLTNPQLAKTLDAIGVTYSTAASPLAAIAKPGTVAVVEATPENLKILAGAKGRVEAFTRGGGWLVLSGLTPDGLADYNRVVGVDHMIRPFRRERVTFPAKRSPLTAGLSNADIVLSSGQRVNGFSDDVYLASDAFSYVVDYDEVAPFATLPPPSYWGYQDAGNDHNPYNIVNGFTSSDGWQLIFSIWAGPGGKPQVPLNFPKPQEITELEWVGNAFYYPTRKIELDFDGVKKAAFDTVPNNEPQTFALPPGCIGREVLVKITDWEKAKEPPIVGIDNLRLKAKRSPEFYRTVHPLLNIGALMAYDRGAGGIILCNVRFQETEAVPENKRKKQNILATVLRNLKAPFSGGASVIAGAPLVYMPIDLSKQANQYRDEKGWFGNAAFTFKDLPTGKQTFAGVPFSIYQFPTSPVPTAVMLSGPGVPNNLADAVRGIPVGRKADALFFLQTARLDARRSPQEVREKKRYEMARYVVTYEDGQKVTIPLYAEVDLDDYKQKDPKAIPGAQIGWRRPYEGTEFSAVAYVKQWDNPRPNVPIRSVDLEYGPDRRGVPVLLAVTAATVR